MIRRVEIVFCGTGWFPLVDVIRSRLPGGASIRIRDPARPVADEIANADVVLPSNERIARDALRAAHRLRLIQQPAAGYDGIDLDLARALGVPVCNAPGANGASVAEAALFLILALARRLPRAQRDFQGAHIGSPVGHELSGKVLGLIGRGRSGARLAAVGEALGMRVLSVSSRSSRRDLFEMLEQCDVVSVHCPLTPETRSMIDAEALSHLKPGAHLVNCARGPILERASIEHALASGRLGGLGLDTYWVEPWDPCDPLYLRDDVVALPHVAGSTKEAFARIAGIVVENVRRLGSGEPLLHRIA